MPSRARESDTITPEYLAALTAEAKRLWTEQRSMRTAGVEIDETLAMEDWYAGDAVSNLHADPTEQARQMLAAFLRAARSPRHKAYREGPDLDVEMLNDGTVVSVRVQMGFG